MKTLSIILTAIALTLSLAMLASADERWTPASDRGSVGTSRGGQR